MVAVKPKSRQGAGSRRTQAIPSDERHYIRDRLSQDSEHTVQLARVEELVRHKGLRGRLRELLVDNLLSPWLFPSVACGTGAVIDSAGTWRQHTQDDIVLFDKDLIPPVLASSRATEGVFPFDGVIARIEVKSTLSRTEVRRAVHAADEFHRLQFGMHLPSRRIQLPRNYLFAFQSDLTKTSPHGELVRMLEVIREEGIKSCPIACLCVVGSGVWLNAEVSGRKATRSTGTWHWVEAGVRRPEVVRFVVAIADTAVVQHHQRVSRRVGVAISPGLQHFVDVPPSDLPKRVPRSALKPSGRTARRSVRARARALHTRQ